MNRGADPGDSTAQRIKEAVSQYILLSNESPVINPLDKNVCKVLTTKVVNTENMMARKQTIDKLMELGLSEYEAKAYVALLKTYPVSAYEVARNASLPTAKIYGVLAKLLEKEMVLELHETGKKKFAPIDPDEFLSHYEQRISGTLEILSEELSEEKTSRNVSYIWNITGYTTFLDRARAMIKHAEMSVLLSVWHEEWMHLVGTLKKKTQSGIKAATVFFGHADEKVGQVYDHPIAETLYQERGGRGFALVTDNSTALMGTVGGDETVEGAWSTNRGFVTLAEDYIKHDVYIMKIVNRFDLELIRRFGPGYRRLRDIFTDTEEG